jgi:DNA-3-methyladenine glycosylase
VSQAADLRPEALEPIESWFYQRPLLVVARDLLGRLLVCDRAEGRAAVRIVEVEAYDGAGGDPASHAYGGRTARNAVMFGPPGHLYVYFIYGMHYCVNVVLAPEGTAQAVLLRAGEPVLGADLMAARRWSTPASEAMPSTGDRRRRSRPASHRDLARGPARLAEALGLGTWANGADLRTSAVRLTQGWPVPDEQVTWTGRVGVSAAADRPWRALVAGSPYVSPGRAGSAKRTRTKRDHDPEGVRG